MPGTVAEGPTVQLSFANNFWGKDDAGVQPLLERMHNAKVTSDELKSFYSTRAAIEDEYARKLLALASKPFGSCEAGTLRASFNFMRGEVESMGKGHQQIARQMKTELEEPLALFAGGIKERRKMVQSGIEKTLKIKVQQTNLVNKSRDRYEQDCLRIKGYLAQGHMVMGQEERKNKAKLEKTQIQVATASNEYEAAIKALQETTGRWNRDWKQGCDKFQDLEEERLDFTKKSMWLFADISSMVCVTDDASCEKIRQSLENCEVEKDIVSFIQERGTGQEIPDPPKYINFCRDTDTASESSEDESYSVAQFQRSIKPEFRSSSPQPSVFDSHHDPHSELAMKMGHHDPSTPPSRETTITPQKVIHQPPAQLDYRRQAQNQAQAQALLQSQQMDLAPVPHNEYPPDGMTMFCRSDIGSERSSNPSPMRPSSRDSQSEYSNPTSFSSVEPATGKPLAKQTANGNSHPESSTKQVLKKRSGFFSNSPFRRKSKYEKERPKSMGPPSSRNTWGPASSGAPASRGSVQSRDFANDDQEPVDPRANFQLNVGPNVFDVASPDSTGQPQLRSGSNSRRPLDEMDPIAAALAELKGVTKQSSVRMSADRYHGIATPAPGAQIQHNSTISAAQRGTPPPGYHDTGSKRLDAPQPAHTSAQMQAATRKYAGQNADMYGSNARPSTSGGMPHSTSPMPLRSASPRPGMHPQHSQQPAASFGRASPNPYASQNQGSAGRSRQGMIPQGQPSPQKQQNYGSYSRHNSPREITPQAQYARQDRPQSSGGMAVQLAQPGQLAQVGGSGPRGRDGRPVSYYGGAGGGSAGPVVQHPGDGMVQNRVRSKSLATDRQFTRDGREILYFARAMYSYTAATPEELGFAKGDILAVLGLQDDGWWEAEVTTKKGRYGLVPSNYLQRC